MRPYSIVISLLSTLAQKSCSEVEVGVFIEGMVWREEVVLHHLGAHQAYLYQRKR